MTIIMTVALTSSHMDAIDGFVDDFDDDNDDTGDNNNYDDDDNLEPHGSIAIDGEKTKDGAVQRIVGVTLISFIIMIIIPFVQTVNLSMNIEYSDWS